MKYPIRIAVQNIPENKLVEDIIAVAKHLKRETLSKREYDNSGVNKFSSGTICRKLGSWKNALIKAGLPVTDRPHPNDDDLLNDLKRVVELISPRKITKSLYLIHGRYSSSTIIRRIGWNAAKAKIDIPVPATRGTREEYFNNMEEVWIKLGRQPRRRDMIRPMSKYLYRAYIDEFGSWNKALLAFGEHVNSIEPEMDAHDDSALVISKNDDSSEHYSAHRTKREASLKLRFLVMKRDHFRCRSCGRSPATDHTVVLELDHVKPWAEGGETVLENLVTLCFECNRGKGSSLLTDE